MVVSLMKTELLTANLFPAAGSGEDRPPGLHVSDIYSDIDRTLNGTPEHWENAAEPGFIWEDVFSKAWSDKAVKRGLIFRPEPEQVDGVWVSPDGVNIEEPALEELKFTWRSSSRSPEDNWKWMTQIKAYLYCLGLTGVHLRVFYINGDYKDRRPKYQPYRLTFEADELLENWAMLINHAKSKGWL